MSVLSCEDVLKRNQSNGKYTFYHNKIILKIVIYSNKTQLFQNFKNEKIVSQLFI